MSREQAIAHAERYFDEGGFAGELARRVAIPTESQDPSGARARRYLRDEMTPASRRSASVPHPRQSGSPAAVPDRRAAMEERPPTVLAYGHGDVIRGQDAQWRAGLTPWALKGEGDRLYGRGTADNKGQHTINLAALASCRGRAAELGFNSVLIETGEETGSPGCANCSRACRGACRRPADRLGRAASRARPADDLPGLARRARFRPRRGPARGRAPFGELGRAARRARHRARARDRDDRRRARPIRVPEWRARVVDRSVRVALADCEWRRRRTVPRSTPMGRAGPDAGRARVRLVAASRCWR